MQNSDTSTYPVLFIEDLDKITPQSMLIEDTLPEQVSAYLYGDDSTCKSGLVEETAMRMVYGLDWFGKNLKAGAVCIVVGEGDADIRKLVAAFLKDRSTSYDLTTRTYPLMIIPEAVMLDKDEDIRKLALTIRTRLKETPLSLLIFDTLASCLEDASETDNAEMSKVNNRMRVLQNYVWMYNVDCASLWKRPDKRHARSFIFAKKCRCRLVHGSSR